MPQLSEANKKQFIELVDAALDCQFALWDSLRDIEQFLATELDGLEGQISDWAAGGGNSIGDPHDFDVFWKSLDLGDASHQGTPYYEGDLEPEPTLDEEQIKKRTRIWHEVDSRACLRCGKEWKHEDIENPKWFVDSVMANNDEGKAIILCPECW